MSTGRSQPRTSSEYFRRRERDDAMLERSMARKARASDVAVLNKYVDILLASIAPGLAEPVEIPNAANLNTYTTQGIYHQSSTAEAAAGTNYPEGTAGLLEVLSIGDIATGAGTSGFVYQRYTVYGPFKRVWLRTYYNNTWYAWQLISEDTGWVTLQASTASVPRIQYRRSVSTVTVEVGGTFSAGLPNNANTTLGSNIVPSGARPITVADGSARLAGGAGTAFLIVDSTGNLLIRNMTGTSQTVISSAQVTYLRA